MKNKEAKFMIVKSYPNPMNLEVVKLDIQTANVLSDEFFKELRELLDKHSPKCIMKIDAKEKDKIRTMVEEAINKWHDYMDIYWKLNYQLNRKDLFEEDFLMSIVDDAVTEKTVDKAMEYIIIHTSQKCKEIKWS